jgi:hypothetical protein
MKRSLCTEAPFHRGRQAKRTIKRLDEAAPKHWFFTSFSFRRTPLLRISKFIELLLRHAENPSNRLPMFRHVLTARLFSAISASQVVGGIKSFTCGTGIFFPGLLQPLGIPHRSNSLKVLPKLNPMRSFHLKGL